MTLNRGQLTKESTMPQRHPPASSYRRQLSVVGSLVFATALCGALLALRMAYTRGFMYADMLWNLFLAWLPVLSSLAAYNAYRRHWGISTVIFVGAAFLWLIFFPNAPYLMTDLMHLRPSNAPIWFDLILLIAFAWTGTFLGLVSLFLMQSVIRRIAGILASWAFALGALAAGSFGIYLGRYLRLNSWDIFTQPGRILRDILSQLRHPFANLQTYAFSGLFFLLLLAAYWMLVALAHFSNADALVDGTSGS
jgi:uncharacterized membrane protein